MTSTQELTGTLINAMSTALGTGTPRDQDPAEEPLRLLATLKPILHELLDRAAHAIGSSQVRAAAFLTLAEGLYRISGYGQFLASARAIDAQVHTITEAPLAELNALLADPAGFITGTRPLPADATNPANRKPLYRDETEYLKTQQNLTYFQAAHRIESAANLLPHTGFNGRPVPPPYPRLGKILHEASADPRTIATLAKALHGMRMEIEQYPNPVTITQEFEAELADAVLSRNTEGTGKLLKDQSKRLGALAIQHREEHDAHFIGVHYLGHTRKGYEYKVITNAEGHELLSTAADILGNTRTNHRNHVTEKAALGRAGSGSTSGSGAAAGSDSSSTPPLPIPEWAIDPSTPMDQRPRSGFDNAFEPTAEQDVEHDDDNYGGTDYGASNGAGAGAGEDSALEPGFMLLPGETLPKARTRQRAARLHQLLLDSIRILATGTANNTDPDGGPMPMKPHFTLAVTIDYQSLTGALENAGFTDHGQDLSATECRRLACNAGILPVILDGRSVPLELGRSKRYFNRAQRRAIAVRDKGCCNPGCSMAVNRTEAHHLDEWSAGGNTDVSRGCLLCVRCHTDYHAGHFSIVMIHGLPHVIQPKSVDPQQVPRRNWIFHPAATGIAA